MSNGSYRRHDGSGGTSSNPENNGSGFGPGGGGNGGGGGGGFQGGLGPPPTMTFTMSTTIPSASDAAEASAASATATEQAIGTTTAVASTSSESTDARSMNYTAMVIGIIVVLFVFLVPAAYLVHQRIKRKKNHRRSIGGLSMRSGDLQWWKQQEGPPKPVHPWWNRLRFWRKENESLDMDSYTGSYNRFKNMNELTLQKPSSVHRSTKSGSSSRSISVYSTSTHREPLTPPIPPKHPRRSMSVLTRPGLAATRSSQMPFPNRAEFYNRDTDSGYQSELGSRNHLRLARSKSAALPQRTMSDQSHIHPALRTNFVNGQRPHSMPELDETDDELSEREKQLLLKYKGPIRFGMGVQKRMSVESIFPLRPTPALGVAQADVLIGIVESTKEELLDDDETVRGEEELLDDDETARGEEVMPGGFVV
ncbi:hypothetical protein BP5796_10253 [Coleophoma crateriformis]|uniref:Uncharacterized protein n=1 Tax=Coleophoma crateriformis TaxID=565419 RepID=A0A3D8QV50_9HELO|nr:hypothetical protein BP5796_10253 [Coleophoma crateriformis]